MNLYRRATKHFDMKRIKELNKKEEKKLKVKISDPDLSDWRSDINV